MTYVSVFCCLVNKEADLVRSLLEGYDKRVKPTAGPTDQLTVNFTFSLGRVISLVSRDGRMDEW